RLRQGLGDLRCAHGGERADLALAVAFEEAREGARAGQAPHQRTAADAGAAPRRHEGADVLRLQRRQPLERRLAAEMLCHECEKLPDVAAIGLERFWR